MSKTIDTYLGKKVAEDKLQADILAEAKSKVNDAYIALRSAHQIASQIDDKMVANRIGTTATIVNDLWKEVSRMMSEYFRMKK